ncbi:hypothetical protein, partial [Ralstonia solanacearum]|uniref:hypothetical protein n=1 Tax=Ralstonia solanacearum TaxID=305 RepID=UPI001E385A36
MGISVVKNWIPSPNSGLFRRRSNGDSQGPVYRIEDAGDLAGEIAVRVLGLFPRAVAHRVERVGDAVVLTREQ